MYVERKVRLDLDQLIPNYYQPAWQGIGTQLPRIQLPSLPKQTLMAQDLSMYVGVDNEGEIYQQLSTSTLDATALSDQKNRRMSRFFFKSDDDIHAAAKLYTTKNKQQQQTLMKKKEMYTKQKMADVES